MGRARSCGWCAPGPGRPALDAPDPGCDTCAAAEWAMFPGVDLDAETWRVISGLLDLRAGGRCEGCGHPFIPGVREPNRHHRRARGMGGSSDPAINGLANLLLLCAGPNGRLGGAAPGCHADVQTLDRLPDGTSRGLVVERGSYIGGAGLTPPEVDKPLVLHSGRRVLLDPHGIRYLPAPARAA